jgi:predicted  nucleic acid-binding Zn-ribbon protein
LRAQKEKEAAERAKKQKQPGGGKGKKSALGRQAPKRYRRFKGSVEELEAEIEKFGEKIKAIETQLGESATYENPDKARELTFEYEELKTELESLEEEWLDRAG